MTLDDVVMRLVSCKIRKDRLRPSILYSNPATDRQRRFFFSNLWLKNIGGS